MCAGASVAGCVRAAAAAAPSPIPGPGPSSRQTDKRTDLGTWGARGIPGRSTFAGQGVFAKFIRVFDTFSRFLFSKKYLAKFHV